MRLRREGVRIGSMDLSIACIALAHGAIFVDEQYPRLFDGARSAMRELVGVIGMITFKPSPIHGMGGFATQDIPQGIRLVEYVGERIGKQESLRRCEGNNPFIFSLNEKEDIDGDVEWNPARLLNHSCQPNCDAVLEDGCIWIIANREVRAGEELTFNYGFDLEDYRDYPCTCGSQKCVGFIVAEEFFEHLTRRTGILPVSQL